MFPLVCYLLCLSIKTLSVGFICETEDDETESVHLNTDSDSPELRSPCGDYKDRGGKAAPLLSDNAVPPVS